MAGDPPIESSAKMADRSAVGDVVTLVVAWTVYCRNLGVLALESIRATIPYWRMALHRARPMGCSHFDAPTDGLA
jgi:hypothetical protein